MKHLKALETSNEFNLFEDPIRSEIFSAARLEIHGESLAHAQSVIDDPRLGRQIEPRISENRRLLEKSYVLLLKAADEKRAVSPAAEWLIDNFHIVRAQLKDVYHHLPPEFYRELPKLSDGPLAGFPRVYGITWAFVAHTDSRFDAELLQRFLKSYQRVQPLTIGELWAVAITLRLVLIENLRRLSARIVGSQEARFAADEIADELLGLKEGPTRTVDEIVSEMSAMPFVPAFAVQLLQRLRFQESRVTPVLQWIDRRLEQDGLSGDDVVSVEHASQTGANATVRNIITSFRLMSAFNWQDFFESVSLVNDALNEHPLYKKMDFATRDRYRHGLEELARHSELTELEVAQVILEKAALGTESEERFADPGYYLISKGRSEVEREIKFQPPLRTRLLRRYEDNATFLYLISIFLVTLFVLYWPLHSARLHGTTSYSLFWLAILAAIPCSEIAVAIVNRMTIGLVGPRHLPRLSLENGIPPHLRTFIVVPTMFSHLSKIEAQIEQLEIHYLANSDGDVYFALLTDWLDASAEFVLGDEKMIDLAARRLARLNDKYGLLPDGSQRFYVFHRCRQFNESEGKWIGWERKRGKLHEFNRLLRNDTTTSFISIDGKPLQVPSGVRYVITLDADTKLPNGAVAQLVGTLAHPLNQARFNDKRDQVVGGYGILQPRITPALPSTRESTIYQKLSTGPSGIDPYASAISDVYQDLFGEGSYTGKGIYDVDAFEQALKERIPENSLLSHDLFEGNFARCGFLSDVELFEDFPSHSSVAAARTHRWTRGDWQLLPWLFGSAGHSMTTVGRWKMFDNLRRSLSSSSAYLMVVAAISIRGSNPVVWLILFFLSLSIPALVSFIVDMLPARRNISPAQHLKSAFEDLFLGLGRFLLSIILLASNAWVAVDAISRALYRRFYSKRLLLEWTTAAQAQAAANLELKDFIGSMWGAVALSLFCFLIVGFLNPHALPLMLPLAALWFISPMLARQLSLPPKEKLTTPLTPRDLQLLNLTARKIWRFFATFVTEDENFLPPDNFQEDPVSVIAHRSSPTNFGLYLLSVIAARDFGWIGVVEMTTRLESTLKSMLNLPKFQGHFFNWYETTGARALEPKYISSVDNGNLAGHLLVVAEACTEALEKPFVSTGFNRGILQTLLLFEASIKAFFAKNPRSEPDKSQNTSRSTTEIRSQNTPDIARDLEDLATVLLTPDHLIPNQHRHWDLLKSRVNAVITTARELTRGGAQSGPSDVPSAGVSLEASEVLAWARALGEDIHSSAQDHEALMPWSEFTQLERISSPGSEPSSWDEIIWPSIKAQLLLEVKLRELPQHTEKLIATILGYKKTAPAAGQIGTPLVIDQLLETLELSLAQSRRLCVRLVEIHDHCHKLYREMDFGLLFDPVRKLFSIGYRVSENALDQSYYDLLASEARLTSFVAIAKGDVPASHWFRLGRGLTTVDKNVVLLSWSGSMFEYLMPSLVMYEPPGSLLDKTCHLIIKRQIEYGFEQSVPWGISESAYNKRDVQLTYQYSCFGIPDLALKRGLGADLVVAPYATLLAAMYEPSVAVENLRKLAKLGAEGPYGFYEAVDFTPARLPEGKTEVVVRNYMAHHQGMSLVAIANIFKNGIMQNRFHSEASVQATELLLQERTPRNVGIIKPNEASTQGALVREETAIVSRRYHSVNRPIPTTQLLANEEYAVMLTSSGSGYSRFNQVALSRWREDVTKDNWGSYIYIKDASESSIWSATYQPTCVENDRYEVTFTDDRAKFSREEHGIASELEVFISPEDNAEIRQLRLTNTSDQPRELEVTSFFEVVLAPQLADLAHPAFSNLFVQTEYLQDIKALLATRRPRSANEKSIWMAQVILTDRHATGEIQYETDRARFIGRGNTPRTAAAVFNDKPLAGTVGSVLDPVMSLRTRLVIESGATARVVFTTVAHENRDGVVRLADKFRDLAAIERATDLAWTQAQVKLHFLNIEPDEAHLFQRLATRLLYSDSSLRPSGELIKQSTRDMTGLWAHGISGDNPIILVRIDDIEDRGIIRQLLKAHEYLGAKRLTVDLVILNDRANSYAQELHESLQAMVEGAMTGSSPATLSARGKVFVLRSDLLSNEDRLLLYSTARATLSSRQGSLAEQVKRMRASIAQPPAATQALAERPGSHAHGIPLPMLDFFNGLGGFARDSHEYVIALNPGEMTPAPWINVIANSGFGFQVSECGSGFTWALNSRENQLTPWSNDPVCDPPGEAFFLRDLDSGVVWSPTALPIRIAGATYIARHGQGYSLFEHLSQGIHSKLTQFVAVNEPLKVSRLIISSESHGVRKLSVTSYVEWVLGFGRASMAPTTVTELDSVTGAIFAFNPRSNEYGSRVAFATFLEANKSWTCDRTEFIGRNGTLEAPAGIYAEAGLSGRTGAALDPCAALQLEVELRPKERREIVFFLGQCDSRKEAQDLIMKYRSQTNFKAAQLLDAVTDQWTGILGKIQVQTPDAAMDLMLNRWLLYQTMVCRFWARAAFYQAGGAYGFRDQLQDLLALVTSQPKLAREHILRSASRQFIEGDVQHWWHPPFGRGVRTHFSDDLLWLPYVLTHYLSVTNDHGILDAQVTFLEGPLLKPDQEDSYYTPNVSHNTASLFEHCARALDKSLATGRHGLPLMGAGDWNDGMNRVGCEGKGESVWLAWFLYTNLVDFTALAERRGDTESAERWHEHAKKLQHSIESEAWDGKWYRRAYFDDGTPLGTASADECRIDSLTQTWAVISGAARKERAEMAMDSVEQELVDTAHQMIRLFTPPFDKTSLDPGYIKGYLPGVRENGGQYTHAAVWCVIAQAMLGRGDRAYRLFKYLNPIDHGNSPTSIERYKVEPYVLAADVYSVEPYVGRGGWTWYTGSAGWMYRAGMEFILGLRLAGDELIIDPCIPSTWTEFSIRYEHEKTIFHIEVKNPHGYEKGVMSCEVDGVSQVETEGLQARNRFKLLTDQKEHHVRVVMGPVEFSSVDSSSVP